MIATGPRLFFCCLPFASMVSYCREQNMFGTGKVLEHRSMQDRGPVTVKGHLKCGTSIAKGVSLKAEACMMGEMKGHKGRAVLSCLPRKGKVPGLVVVGEVAEASHPDVPCNEDSDCIVHLFCLKVVIQQEENLQTQTDMAQPCGAGVPGGGGVDVPEDQGGYNALAS